MKQRILLFLLVIMLMTLSSCTTLFVKESTSFIKTNGAEFQLDGRTIYICGTNFWYGLYLGSKGSCGDRERLIRELDHMKLLGINNLRILAVSEETPSKNILKPAIQKKPGEFDEEILDGLDYLLNEMNKRQMHAVVFLNNYWDWSGGMVQYISWVDGKTAGDPNDPVLGWDNFMNLSASFYGNIKANEIFRATINKIITRENKYTGKYYYEDPVIMAWQLANEPRPGAGKEGFENAEIYCKWIDETAKYIRSIDPNHLITTGSEGLAGTLYSDDIYLNSHKSQYIDYMTFHLWPKNWGWFDPENAANTYDSTVTKAKAYITKHIQLARRLNKPLILEEFGLPRDKGLFQDSTTTNTRDKYYRTIFEMIYDSAAAGSPIAGYNFWAWAGEARAKHADGWWKPGDPFMGDPSGEPQGYNSIFNTDKSTLSIIKESTTKFERLSKKERILTENINK